MSDARTAQAPAEEEYLLGTHTEEYERLGFQHRVWAAETYELWEQAGFAPGARILDLGCGPGFASLDLAYWVGRAGRVIAVDASARFLGHLARAQAALDLPQIERRQGDVAELELADGVLDGAFARWVLCFVPRPERVIARVARALRPGGTFAVLDYFRYSALSLAPPSAALERVARAVEESWRRAGGDLDIGGHLPRLFAEAGLEVRQVKPIVRVARPGSALWRWPDLFFRGYVPRLVEMGLLSRADAQAFESDWSARARDPQAFFTTPPIYAVIGVKPGP
jgi:SAM-dependent methyltransferase